jgi:hypothetical protein
LDPVNTADVFMPESSFTELQPLPGGDAVWAYQFGRLSISISSDGKAG